MADSYHIIDGQVVPYYGGRKGTDTDAWRDATALELQLQEQLAEAERATAAQAAEIEALRAEVEAVWAAMPRDARYLDPPDGGCVQLHEQVRRMAADATRAERLAEAGRRVTAAFRALGDSSCITAAAIKRRECEAAMLAFDALLRDQDEGK